MQVWQSAKRLKHPIFATRNLSLKKFLIKAFNLAVEHALRLLPSVITLYDCYNDE
jgi:hypothetical protein